MNKTFMLGEGIRRIIMVVLKMYYVCEKNEEQDINEDGLELQETRELERNQLEALQEDDFAVSDEEDEEDEEDAKMNLGVSYFFLILLQFGIMEEEVRKNVADLSGDDIDKILRKSNPELFVLVPDLQSKLKALSSTIKPYAEGLHQDPPVYQNQVLSEVGEEYIDTKIQTYLNYCLMLGSYMLLKSDKKDVRNHPIMQYLVKAR